LKKVKEKPEMLPFWLLLFSDLGNFALSIGKFLKTLKCTKPSTDVEERKMRNEVRIRANA
jgi:hypothetical protein